MSKGSFSTTPPNPVTSGHCPYCDAERRPSIDGRCWLCWQPLTPSATAVATAPATARSTPVIRHPSASKDNTGWIFFGTFALMTALGVAFVAPGVLIAVVIVSLPAAIRTLVVASRRSPGDNISGPVTVVGTFLGALGVTIAVGLAAAIAFFATCFAVCAGLLAVNSASGKGGEMWMPEVSAFMGIVGAILVTFLVCRWLFFRKG